MADRKISDLTALTAPASGDFLPIVDISEAAAATKNKRITIEELMRGMPDGTAAAPGIAFENDPNTGIYSPGADQVAVATNGVGRLFVDSAGTVGVGINSSIGKLTTQGAIAVLDSAAANSVIAITADTGAAAGSTVDVSFLSGGNGPLKIKTGGSESLRIDSSGRLLVGSSSARSLYGQTGVLQTEGLGYASSGINLILNNASTAGPLLVLGKSRGSAIGSNTIVQNGDTLGSIFFCGADGSDLDTPGGGIYCEVDGTPGANDMPGRLVFSTTADGASSPTERMRIKSTGTINFSNVATYADNTAALAGGLVAGDVYRKSDGTLMITY